MRDIGNQVINILGQGEVHMAQNTTNNTVFSGTNETEELTNFGSSVTIDALGGDNFFGAEVKRIFLNSGTFAANNRFGCAEFVP